MHSSYHCFMYLNLGGGLQYFSCSSLKWGMIQFDDHIFQHGVGENSHLAAAVEFFVRHFHCRGGGGCARRNTSIGRRREKMVAMVATRSWSGVGCFCFFCYIRSYIGHHI